MKRAGVLLAIAGILFGFAALSMDTSVATEAQSIGGIEIPSQRVNNLGLMDQRRNLLMIAGVMTIAGVVLTATGALQPPVSVGAEVGGDDNRQCPFCAETIKSQAIVCRFCGRDVPAIEAPVESVSEGADRGSVPMHIRDLYGEARARYEEWANAAFPEDAWVDDDDVASKQDAFLHAFGEVANACESEAPAVWGVVGRKAARDFPLAKGEQRYLGILDSRRA